MFLNIFFWKKSSWGSGQSGQKSTFLRNTSVYSFPKPWIRMCLCVIQNWKSRLKTSKRCSKMFFFHYQREALVQQVFSKSRHCQNLPQWFILPSSSPGFSLPTYSPSITSHKSMSCCCGASTVAILCSTVGTLSSTVTILCSTVAILCSTVAILCSTVAI